MPKITLLDCGFRHQSIFLYKYKSASSNEIKAVVKAEGFGGDELNFSISVIGEKGDVQGILEVNNNHLEEQEGNYVLPLIIKRGNGKVVMRYRISCGVTKFYSFSLFLFSLSSYLFFLVCAIG